MALTLNPNAAEYVPPSTLSAPPCSAGSVKLEKQQRRRTRQARRGEKQRSWWTQQQMAAQQQWAAACWAAYQQAAMGYNYCYPPPSGASDDELDEEFYGDYISDEHLQEMAECDAWVETMIQLDEEEREHLTAMALELAPAAGWHIEHNLLLVDGKEPKPLSARKQKGSKQRRTNRGSSRAHTPAAQA
uniref:Ataxin-2 C-terminal domain-containing protein n=1 Tax=Dunaliella tertiolecta TaxID=3047 RepID=A0A7S3R6Q6_DUNTE|eukprot:CAMPEP_0202346906 /NCGR_PEP_ID=MMETSP1126-20121109/5493_1 /ASSEMBLY_ACC=CAM_ASM_000457 /TAXON_ID=3047 /ORGANISM="Dunaliella tertiolecta, Strain CCMP1320" /LENGTH=187 /DNA_ID=CAMNT_0048938375 /DNA_START=47 /DNA_END=610 /DNA_ORIENTATION=-